MTTDLTNANRDLMERFYAAGIAGDMETFFGCLDPELTVTEPPFLPFGGVHHGIESFQQLFGKIVEMIDVSSIVVESLSVDGDRAYAVLNARLQATSVPVSLCEEWQLRDGRIIGARVWYWDPAPTAEVF